MPNRHKPKRLRHGDTVGAVAPASAPRDPSSIDAAVPALDGFGFKRALAKNIRAQHGFLAGTDRERAVDLMQMFCDRRVRTIFCLRGGYGSARTPGRLDYDLIAENPKLLCGCSHITPLHCALLHNLNLATPNGPTLSGALADPQVPAFTRNSFFRNTIEPMPAGSVCASSEGETISVLRGGKAMGRLAGGYLCLICASLATPFAPSLRKTILFLEEVGNKPYRMDRMPGHLLNSGILNPVAGVEVGINHDCHDSSARAAGEFHQSERDVICERLGGLSVPVVMGLPSGHVAPKAIIPLGVKGELDADRGDLMIQESALN